MAESPALSAVGATSTSAQVGFRRGAFMGSCKHRIWEAIRASSAAPYYLDDYSDGTFPCPSSGYLSVAIKFLFLFFYLYHVFGICQYHVFGICL